MICYFLLKIFQKRPKNNFFGLLFQNILPEAQKVWPNESLCFGGARKINLV